MLENYQCSDGSVKMPEALKRYLDFDEISQRPARAEHQSKRRQTHLLADVRLVRSWLKDEFGRRSAILRQGLKEFTTVDRRTLERWPGDFISLAGWWVLVRWTVRPGAVLRLVLPAPYCRLHQGF